MNSLGARWSITDEAAGRHVVYHNLVRGLVFDCGHTNDDMGKLLQFIVSEGDPGDMVFLNDLFYTQIHKGVVA